jgi:glutathione S-transferase
MATWPKLRQELVEDLGDKPYFGGPEFSAVDCSVGYMLRQAKASKLLDEEKAKPLKEYMGRVEGRESYQKTFD